MKLFSLLDLPGFEPPRSIEVLDIGARLEGRPRWAALAERNLARITGFEPQAEDRRKIESAGISIDCLPHFLGDGGAATFHITRWPGNCSLLEPDPAVIDAFHGIGASHSGGNFFVMSTERVQTTRLDAIGDLPSPDFIKLDIQGAELSVLENGLNTLSHALVVETEAAFAPLYRDQPLFGDLHMFMRSRGFAFHRFMDIAGRCYQPFALSDPSIPVSQPLWADAIFVRDPIKLSRWTGVDLLIGAVILHELYGSFDLVLRLLAEHDRRHSGQLSPAYIERFREMGSVPANFASLAHVAQP